MKQVELDWLTAISKSALRLCCCVVSATLHHALQITREQVHNLLSLPCLPLLYLELTATVCGLITSVYHMYPRVASLDATQAFCHHLIRMHITCIYCIYQAQPRQRSYFINHHCCHAMPCPLGLSLTSHPPRSARPGTVNSARSQRRATRLTSSDRPVVCCPCPALPFLFSCSRCVACPKYLAICAIISINPMWRPWHSISNCSDILTSGQTPTPFP